MKRRQLIKHLKDGDLKTMKRKKIKATYKNGVIEPLDKLNLPEGQKLEVEFSVLQKTPHELSRKKKKRLNPEDRRLNERDMGKHR